MEYLDRLVEFISGHPPLVIYLVLFAGAFLENILPPVPGDTLIVFGAYLAGRGVLNELEVFAWLWVGSFSGGMLVYALGYRKGRVFFNSWSPRIFSEERFGRAERWFTRYGGKLIVFSRFIPAVRCVIGISAGISKVRPLPMAAYLGVGTLLWNGLLVYAGLLVGTNWRLILRILSAYNRAMLAVLLLALALGAVYAIRRRKRIVSKP
jgi:membrane protein DedA with SNARE-associated domain